MKTKILILFSVLSVVLSLLTIPSFAFDEQLADVYPVSLGFYPVEYTGGDVDYDGDVYILARYSNYKSWYSSHLYNIGGSLYYETSYYNGTEDVILTRKYDSSTHYLVADFESLGGSSFAPESNTDFFSVYKRSVRAYDIYKVGWSYGLDYPELNVSDKSGYLVYPESNDVWITTFPFVNLIISQNVLSINNGQNIGPGTFLEYDLSTSAPLYFSWHESFSLMGEDDLHVPESLPLFYLYMTPVLSDTPVEPQPPVVDGDDSPTIFEPVKTLIFGIFEGLSSLEIYPGISLLAIVFGFVGLYLARYLIKLIAGG